jgi:hypothetical protein
MNNLRLIIANQRHLIKWDKDWVYIGRNFSSMQEWDKAIGSGKRILLTRLFRQYFEHERHDFLDWCDEQRSLNKDSLHWWMSHLAGKNNMSSFLYESICQIKALRNALLDRLNTHEDILVVCENVFLCNAVISNVEEICKIDLTSSYHKGRLRDWSRFLVAIPFGLFRTLLKLFKIYIASVVSRKYLVSNIFKDKDVYLIHQCLDTKSFLRNGKLADRYFSLLPSWLEEKGKNVVRLPWLFNVHLPSNQVFKRLRQDHCLIIEDYLNLMDYLKAVSNFIKSIFSVSKSVRYSDFKIDSLLVRESLLQASASSNIRFWLYGPALRKWAQGIDKITFIYTFELMPPEHNQIFLLRKFNPKIKFLGYYHSLVSRDFLAYWNQNMKMGSSILPDFIITNGDIGKEILINQGYDEECLISGPALRQNFSLRTNFEEKEGLILLCPFDCDSAFEAILKLKSALDKIPELEINIQVKAHPMIVKSEILNKLPKNKLPNGWEWNDLDISEAIESRYCCIILASASIYDAILSDCIVISMQRELSSMGNFGDILQDKFSVLKEVPDEDLSTRIYDVFLGNKKFYRFEFEKIKLELLKGLNPVNESSLKVFLNEHTVN